MSPKTNNLSINHSSTKAVKHWSVFLVLFLVVSLLVIAAVYTSLGVFRDLHTFTLSRRQAVAGLAASVVRGNLEKVIDVGISLSDRAQFQEFVESGNWNKAIKRVENVPKDFSYIERVALFDSQGTLWAVTPLTPELSAVIGKDFSYRDYYQGVSKNWEPYVAEAIKPAVPLGYNLIPVAIPIKSEQGTVLGILLLNVKLDAIAAWSKNIDVGPAGFVYIVDQKGHLVAHPTLLPAEDIVDFSSVPAVQKVLKGERGVEVLFNPIENEERVTAYEPVSPYGWGVVVVQPTRTAFIERDKEVRRMATVWVLIIFAVGFFTYRLLRDRIVIQAQRDRERLLLNSIGDGVIAIDRDFDIVSWNKAATVLTGWSREEVLGKPMREVVKFVRESDKKENIVFIEEAMLYSEPKTMEPNTLLIRKDGTEIPVGDSAAPVFDSSGKVTGAIIVFRDISGEKEEQKIRGEIMFQTVHDLRAPATAIKLAAEMSQDAEFLSHNPEKLKESIGLIQEANTRMLGLINSLLDSARSKAGMVKNESVVIQGIIKSIIKEFTPAAARKNVKFEYLPQPDLPRVFAHPERLKEIFSNLIDNAIKYNKDGGTVTIAHKMEDDFVKTVVKDTGVGISAENLSKLFTPYFRVDGRQQIQGTGLGLFIVKKFIEEMSGNISVDSRVGEGTVFTVSLPIAK
ncbi:MAG: ATP-binding protein [Candidatus Taylorbacteria bacterium]|nr:ATP-binding protein [Candidatus Taylorbacteria bacterium]